MSNDLRNSVDGELRWSPDGRSWTGCANENDMPAMPERVVICDETLREGEGTGTALLEAVVEARARRAASASSC